MELFFNIIISILVLSTLVSYGANMVDFNRVGYYTGNTAIISFFICMIGIIGDIAYLIIKQI